MKKLVLSFPSTVFDKCLHWYWWNSQERKENKEKEKNSSILGASILNCIWKRKTLSGIWAPSAPLWKGGGLSSVAGCSICITHLLLLEIELLHLTGCAWNDSILTDPGTLNIKLNYCAAKCGVDSVLLDRLITDSSSLKPASVLQDRSALFSPSFFMLLLTSKSFNHPFLSLSALQKYSCQNGFMLLNWFLIHRDLIVDRWPNPGK